jgi:hypothetical protein
VLDDLAHTDLTVALRERPDQDRVEVGVIVADAFVPFAAVALGDYQERINTAAEEKAQQQQAAAQQQQASGQGQPPPNTGVAQPPQPQQ